jgi:hypothetical protein
VENFRPPTIDSESDFFSNTCTFLCHKVFFHCVDYVLMGLEEAAFPVDFNGRMTIGWVGIVYLKFPRAQFMWGFILHSAF